MAGNTTDPGRSVANKVAAILMAFADGSVRTLSEIASSAQLPSSTAHRLASELVVWRLLERTEDGGYRVGLPLRIIGKDATESDILNRAVLVVRARPVLAELARTTGTDARLGVLQGGDVVYLNESGPNEVAVAPLSPTLPAHATAIGKALLAFSPTSVVDRVLAEGLGTTKTLTAPDKFRQVLSVIRLTRVATAREQCRVGRSAIAMPVFSGGGHVAAAVELTLHEPGTDVMAATGALTVACRSLSRQLATAFRECGAVHSSRNGNGNGSPPGL
jgi:DNA-binding IclR family transcriptional regulator